MTAMTCELLGCDAIAGPLLVEPRRPSGDDGDTGGDLVPVPSHPLVGRKLAEEAWPIAREIDPEQDGLHVRVLGDRLAQRGLMPDRAQALYDALNHAHDLFRARGKAVWTWMEPGAKAVDGLSSRALADVAVAVLLVHDPDRTGIHAGRQILPILDRWRVPVRGQDRAATLVAAINGDKRFERVAVEVDGRVRTRSGTYRLL